MAVRPLVNPGLAGCCTILSIFGILSLGVIGYGFAHNWEAFMGSINDPVDGLCLDARLTSSTAASLLLDSCVKSPILRR
ncbi:hypothetical protein CBOM_04239 [Ceraceosorus bombacis]|uniref:Uncharacterized protein n=1 Tax=Ceraceosorus bombacis TaxID=401625 RepID=A0A0P1BMY8_9BASI|nr:hypothetical protein CBOM_04239 [Ceraceosorus bombacis]